MNQDFKFAFDSKVKVPGTDLVGNVEGNFIARTSTVARALVGYTTKDGKYVEQWIDEDKLEVAE